MLNLAPIRYRNILAENGGPIAKIQWARSEISPNLHGFEASTWLTDTLEAPTYGNTERHQLYSDCNGMGSDRLKSIACYKAISESLERWAYLEISASKKAAEFGFNHDCTTSGMAAYPGLTNHQVIQTAHYEALERWALVGWWTGQLGAQKRFHEGFDCLELSIPGHGIVCVTWAQQNGKWAYGFAGGKNLTCALRKAQIELYRNHHVLSKWNGAADHLMLQERRVLFFSTPSGHELFLKSMANSLRRRSNSTPNLLVNKELKGPWSKYCTVWRTLYHHHREIDLEAEDYFLF